MADENPIELERLEQRLKALGESARDLAVRGELLSRENRRLKRQLSGLVRENSSSRLDGLLVGVVDGDVAEGEPAPVDAEGRTPVVLQLDGQKQKLIARLATPWNTSGGGTCFLPRKGQAVYLAFENGLPELPVVVGYAPSAQNPLTYPPNAKAPAATLAKTLDSSGQAYNPPTKNSYKGVIRSASPGQAGKASEIAFLDHPGQEGLSLGSEGQMRLHAQGDHYRLAEGDTVDHHVGDYQQSIAGDYTKKVAKDYTRKVGGDFHSQITGNRSQVINGDYHLEVQGQYSIEIASGKSVHRVWESGQTFQTYMGAKDNLILLESLEAHVDLRVRIYTPFRFDFALQRLAVHGLNQGLALQYLGAAATKNENTIATLNNAVANMKRHVIYWGTDGFKCRESGMAMKSFASKLYSGLKVNMP